MEDDRIITFIQVMSVMIPIRSFEVKFHRTGPQGISDPYFGMGKVGAISRVRKAGMHNPNGGCRYGTKGKASQFLESPKIM
jgi:hypothetical protein